MCEKYLGWTNRETWAFMLHINNDESLQSWVHEYVTEYTEHDDDLRRLSASEALAQWAETLLTRGGYVTEFGNSWPDKFADIATDIGSLYRINYYECAGSILSDIAENFA